MRIGKLEIRFIRKSTALHPEFKKLIEFAFDIDGKEFYQFKNPLDMPPLRHKAYEQFLREAEMRMTGEDSLELLNLIEDSIENSKGTDAIMLVRGMKYQISQFLETDTFYRLFTCLFFDLNEDLTDYDYDYNEEKLSLFKSQPSVSFFFQHPMKDWLPLQDLSSTDLQVFLEQTKISREYIQRIKSDILIK